MVWNVPKEHEENFRRAINFIAQFCGGTVFASDLLITLAKSTTFLWDDRFTTAVESTAGDDDERSIIWRMHTSTWAAAHAVNVPGDFVECGVFKALTATVICKYLDFANLPKTFYLYDTFSGMPEATSTERERQEAAHYKKYDPEQLMLFVRNRLAAFPNVRIVRGAVPDSFAQGVPEQIAYLHIDMNSAQAEILALQNLFDRVTPGGIIILDDFGWINYRPQTLAELEFMGQRKHRILELPTGQGMIIKHA